MFPVLQRLPNGISLVRDLDTGKILQKFSGVAIGKSVTEFYSVTASNGQADRAHPLWSRTAKMAKAEAKSRRLINLIMVSEKMSFEEAMSVIGTRDASWPKSVIQRVWNNRHSAKSTKARKIAS